MAKPPPGQWIYEIKFDGYRMLARIEGDDVRLFTRNGNDWTAKLKPLRTALLAAQLPTGWYDGEIIVQGASGADDFNALQNAFDNKRAAGIQYFLFDAPYLDGFDMRRVPVEGRREALRAVLKPTAMVRFSEAFDEPIASLLASARSMGLEGVMGKRKGSPYVHRRSDDWIKLKCNERQEFVIGGHTNQEGARIGALLVGVFDEAGQLQYAGKVGTGFTEEMLAQLRRRLDAIAQPERSFAGPTGHDKRAKWVRPTLVCEVEFTEWRPGGHLRHPSFKGLREDKPARQVTRERRAAAGVESMTPACPVAVRSKTALKVTHGDRVIDTSTGLTKLDLVRYYADVASWVLPHLVGRHVYVKRAPNGIQGEMFFQQHPEGMPGLRGTDIALWPGHEPAIAIDTAEELVAAAQLSVVELHTWNSTSAAIKQPDRVIFDLDPGEGVPWAHVQEAAVLTRAMLQELGLESWLKTTGGKGLHVVVPLVPDLDYERVKAFSRAVVQHMARAIPQRFVAKSGASNRVGKIFIDYLRNGQSQSTAAAFSARARPGLGVSMTVSWDELSTIRSSAQWNMVTAPAFLKRRKDPWAGYWQTRQHLSAALDVLG